MLSSKAILLFYIRTSILLYTHYIWNVIYFLLSSKNKKVHLITLLRHYFTDANKCWLSRCLANCFMAINSFVETENIGELNGHTLIHKMR